MARSIPRMARLARRFGAATQGATAIEYSIIAAGIAGVVVGAVYALGATVETHFYGKIIGGWK